MSKISFKNRIVQFSFAVILFTLNFACTSNIGRKLSEDELVGKWTATKDSIEFLQSHDICCSNKEIKLTLANDKKFELKNMPSCWTFDHESCATHTYDYEGTWSVINTEHSSNTLLLNEGTTHGLSLIKRSGEIQIVFWFGDPDNGRAIYLSKQ